MIKLFYVLLYYYTHVFQKRLKKKAGYFIQLYFIFVLPLNVIFIGPTIEFKSSS